MLPLINYAAWIIQTHRDKSHKIAVIDGHQTITYNQLCTHVQRFAGYLHFLGYKPQQRVIVTMDDSVYWPVAFLGAIYIGMNPVLVHNGMMIKDIERIINISDSALIISDREQNWSIPCISKDTLVECQTPELENFYQFHPDEMCVWLLSSGSTGEPKCIVNRHASLYNILNLLTPVAEINSDSILFSTAKMSWAYGVNVSVTFALGNGATACVNSGIPSPSKIINKIINNKVTHFFSVPTIFASMIKHKNQKLPNNLNVFSSGEFLPSSVSQSFFDYYQVPVRNCIGMAEVMQIYCMQQKLDWKPGNMGKPLPGVICELRDAHDQLVSPGTVGELYVSSPCQASMYWKDWKKTQETFRGKWVRTGDQCMQDEHGNLVFVGRCDDLVKIKGSFVAPSEIESIIEEIPEIEICTVVHAPNSQGLAELYAFIVSNKDIQADYVRQILENKLPSFKIPKYLNFVKSIPKTLTNKKNRSLLRNSLL